MPLPKIKKGIPYNYVVGGPSSKGLPFDVKVSIDPNFERAISKWVTIGGICIGAGIAIGLGAKYFKR